MVVAAGALNPQAQEQLGRVFDLLVGLLDLAIPGHRRVLADLARGRQHLADELVVGHVGVQAVANPIVKHERAAGAGRILALVAQNRVPLVGEVVGIVGAGQQLVDPLVALLRIGIGQKSDCFLGRRQAAGDVDARASQEGRIVAQRRGGHAQRLELLEHQVVDEVFGRRQAVDRRAQRHVRPEDANLTLIAGHDRHVAGLIERLDQAGRADLGHLDVVRLELGRAGHVFGCAVGVMGHDQNLLLALLAHRPLGREHVDPHDGRVVFVAVGHALQNPAPHQPVGVRILLQPGAAAVRGRADRLEQQQALIRRGRKQPPAAALFDQVLEIFPRLEAQQRQLEAVLPARFAVAAAAIAAQFGEDRHDLIGEVDQRLVAQPLDANFRRAGDALGRLGGDRRLAVGQRNDQARGVDAHDAGRGDLVLDRPGQVVELAAGEAAGDRQLLPGVLAAKRKPAVRRAAGVDLQRFQLAGLTEPLGGGGGSQGQRGQNQEKSAGQRERANGKSGP